jgi:pimeloyl-ACP methyl ester carboxylesterase
LRDDLVAVLDQLGSAPVVLSGHSMGATVAVLAAASRPTRVKALVLFDPVLLPPDAVGHIRSKKRQPDDPWPDLPLVQGALRRRATFDSREAAVLGFTGRGAFRSWPKTAVADYAIDGLLERPEGGVRLACTPEWEASNYCAQGHDGWEALQSLTCPVSILRAELFSTCDEVTAEKVAQERPGVSITVVPHASHFIPQELPQLAGAALVAAMGTGALGYGRRT